MTHSVISSRTLSHPLNPTRRMDVAFCQMLDLLENDSATDGELLRKYLNRKGYYMAITLLPFPSGMVRHLESLCGGGFEDGVDTLLRNISQNSRARLKDLSPTNRRNVIRLYRGLLELYRNHIDFQLKSLKVAEDKTLNLIKKTYEIE